MGLTYTPDFSLFEHLRVYVRGFTQITRDCRSVTTRSGSGRSRSTPTSGWSIALKFKAGPEARPAGPLRRALPADVQGRTARGHGDAPARAGDQGPDALDRQGPGRLAAGHGHPDAGAQAPRCGAAVSASVCSAADRRPGHGGGELVLRLPPRQAEAPLRDDPQALLHDAGQQRQRPDPPDRLGRGRGIQGGDARLLLPLAGAGGSRALDRRRGSTRTSRTTCGKRPGSRSTSRSATP